MEIVKTIELCTSHVSEETAKMLDQQAAEHNPDIPLIVYEKQEYGWFVVVPENEEDVVEAVAKLPSDLLKTLEFALNHKCRWIVFDRDVMPSIELPCYEW
jgi:hypothetical protein